MQIQKATSAHKYLQKVTDTSGNTKYIYNLTAAKIHSKTESIATKANVVMAIVGTVGDVGQTLAFVSMLGGPVGIAVGVGAAVFGKLAGLILLPKIIPVVTNFLGKVVDLNKGKFTMDLDIELKNTLGKKRGTPFTSKDWDTFKRTKKIKNYLSEGEMNVAVYNSLKKQPSITLNSAGKSFLTYMKTAAKKEQEKKKKLKEKVSLLRVSK